MSHLPAGSGPVEFDLLADLPHGHLALEASAGTGKTFALAALATRFLAEREMKTSDLLMVTFTRAATSELRARVRERIVQAAAHLALDDPPQGDPLLDHLLSADREVRRNRLVNAVSEFDAATITTIHGFATQVLTTLGVSTGIDPEAALVDDLAQLAAECCSDVLAAEALGGGTLPSSRTLIQRTRTAINIADLRLAPGSDQLDADQVDRLQVELVSRSIAAMRARRRAAGTLSFDDVLVELRKALQSPSAATVLEGRFRVGLVDEFQDTDPVQWAIFKALFPERHDSESSLVLVGDPKQSIYSFRGANVHTYLAAAHGGPAHPPSLRTNWRSDGAVLRATSSLLTGVTFGDGRIAFSDVAAAADHADRRMTDCHGAALPAIDVRLTMGPDLTRNKGGIDAKEARSAIFADLVGQVRELLDGAEIPDESDSERMRAVQPSDIAVLVRSNDDASAVRDALRQQGVPAVLARGASVLESRAATHWRWLLDAMARPADPARARTFALSWFGGRSAEWVAAADDDDLVAIQERLAFWVGVLAEDGVVDFQRRLWVDSDVVATVLARPDGDRDLTDLDHIAELLGTGAEAEHQSVAALLAILDAPEPEEVAADIDRDQLARRVESEALAVRVMTVWVAKGLEFPIVMVPTMWSARAGDAIVPDDDRGEGARLYDLASKPWPDKQAHSQRRALAASEQLGENLRLLYVALTRAIHRTVVWWAPVSSANRAGLTRVLFSRDGSGRLDTERFHASSFSLPDEDSARSTVAAIVESAGGTMSFAVHGHPRAPRQQWSGAVEERTLLPLELAVPRRRPDRSTRRWSFSAMTASSDHRAENPADPTGGDAGAADEGDSTPDVSAHDAPTDGAPGDVAAGVGRLASLPAGAAFGTLVHSVLERVDFASPQLREHLRERVQAELHRHPISLAPRYPDRTRGTHEEGIELLIGGLEETIQTPLGPLFGDRRLADISKADRLDEMEFDLNLAGSGAATTDAELGAVIERHLAPADLFDLQPLHPWAQELARGRLDVTLAGHLTGSIDAVIRVRDAQGASRFLVVDYKTNRLTPRGAPSSPDDYASAELVNAMADHHYPLQALIYTVALHRYLRWRQPGYDPEVHLGGVAYLFVRGMVGSDTPTVGGVPHGVFSWGVAPELVVQLSDLLDGRAPEWSTARDWKVS